MDRTEEMICQHLYLPVIRYSVRKEVNNCDTCQLMERSNITYGKFPANGDEEIPYNKLYVDLIWP